MNKFIIFQIILVLSKFPKETLSKEALSLKEIYNSEDFASCLCDITYNLCDIDCCCDLDCAPQDVAVFTSCINTVSSVDDRTCLTRGLMFQSNSQNVLQEVMDGLFCTRIDNYKEKNYYNIPDLITTDADFDTYLEKYGRFSFRSIDGSSSSREYSKYKIGDPVLIKFENGIIGSLPLPKESNFPYCTDTAFAKYSENEDYSCIRNLKSVDELCQVEKYLDAHTYFNNFKIIANPDSIEVIQDSTDEVNNTMNETSGEVVTPVDTNKIDSTLISIDVNDVHTCKDIEGNEATCDFGSVIPSPSYDKDSGICSNIVNKVKYKFIYNVTQGIKSVDVTFHFISLKDVLFMRQHFGITFMQSSEEETPFVRSGNPGYIVGKPIIAGDLITNEDSDGNILQAISVTDGNQIAIVSSSVFGDCVTDSTQRVPVLFGENIKSGCNIRVTYNNITEKCEILQEIISLALEGKYSPEYVATFGNTKPEAVGDWVKILKDNPPNGPTTSNTEPGVCNGLVMGLHLEIFYAYVGALGNPQAKIIGAVSRYNEPRSLSFQCRGKFCQPGTEDSLTQKFEISSSVGFVDVSSAPEKVFAEKPPWINPLPEDFFYPLS